MDLDGIQANIEQYNAQLKQASAALTLSPDNEELQQLVASLQELIKLTEQQCQEQQQNQQSSRKSDVGLSTDLDNEMALFKDEIATVERQQRKGGADSSDSDPPSPPDGSTDVRRQHTDQIKLSLQSLMGSRCSAPFTQSWGQLEYHPAVIEALDEASLENAASSADVKLRVLFSHPTQRVMQPCRYYLRHSCDYGEAGLDCRFSHGHVVSVADIREYSEPVGQLVASSPVLVRRDDESGLWQRATVQSVDADTEQATVRVTGHRQPRQVALSELVPLPAVDHCPSSSSDLDSSSDSAGDTPAAGVSDPEPDLDPEEVEFCPRVTWETMTCTDQLGSWEKYTKGIGSRLMQQMGYVVGSGLGLRADGRVQPVEARVYPTGRSLDHCMALREGSAAAGGAPLLSVERHLERQQRRQEKLGQREYQRDRQHNAMFDVINRVMGAGSEEPLLAALPTPVREASRHELNQRDLRVGEEIRTAERLVRRLEAGCRRQHGSAAAAALQAQLQQQQTHLVQLRRAEAGIHSEQRQRSDTRRLHLF